MNDAAASVLNELIETSRDGEKGFYRAREETTNPELESLFRRAALRCHKAAHELQECMISSGAKPEGSGSVKAAAQRGWLDLKAAVTGRDDKAILEECEKGEDVAKARYADALKKELPPEVHALVEKQYQGVIENHDRVKALRDQHRAK
jgi:uncharacterized protein (TIGR02284 family)